MKARRRRRRRRRGYGNTAVVGAVCLLLALLLTGWKTGLLPGFDSGWGNADKAVSSSAAEQQAETESLFTQAQMDALSDLPLYSPKAVLFSADDFKCYLYRGGHDRIYPASMTKIMTALVALENIQDLQTPICLSPEMIAGLKSRHASMAGFLPGESVPAIDLIYGAMLPSGAECSVGLAEYVAGSEAAFAALMNQKALELGMVSTNFVTVTGLHNAEHFSTVRDMAVLLAAALKNEQLLQIMENTSYTTQPTELNPEGITFYSTVLKGLEKRELGQIGILGGKTGYTPEAGLCLASFGMIDGKEFILVTAGAEGTPWTDPFHLLDACAVYNCLHPAVPEQISGGAVEASIPAAAGDASENAQ